MSAIIELKGNSDTTYETLRRTFGFSSENPFHGFHIDAIAKNYIAVRAREFSKMDQYLGDLPGQILSVLVGVEHEGKKIIIPTTEKLSEHKEAYGRVAIVFNNPDSAEKYLAEHSLGLVEKLQSK